MGTEKIWIELNDAEKSYYMAFHEASYKEDIQHSEEVVLKFPRWSIISGYYAMHDITKLFLAKHFGIKIVSPQIHAKTIAAIEHFIQDKELREQLLPLLKNAQQTFYNVERLKEKIVPVLLKKGKQEREHSQYYTEDYSQKKTITAAKAVAFIDDIVTSYLKIIEGLL